MKIFVTGATGFIGSAIVQELINAGHHVLGLGRSDAAAKSVIAAGAQVHLGALEDLESLRRAAAAAAAHLDRLVLEKGSTEARYHWIAEDGVPFREIADVIGRRLNVPVVSKTPKQAAEHFAWFAHFAALDNPASSQRTREQLGWHAKQPGLIADIDRPNYFAT